MTHKNLTQMELIKDHPLTKHQLPLMTHKKLTQMELVK